MSNVANKRKIIYKEQNFCFIRNPIISSLTNAVCVLYFNPVKSLSKVVYLTNMYSMYKIQKQLQPILSVILFACHWRQWGGGIGWKGNRNLYIYNSTAIKQAGWAVPSSDSARLGYFVLSKVRLGYDSMFYAVMVLLLLWSGRWCLVA